MLLVCFRYQVPAIATLLLAASLVCGGGRAAGEEPISFAREIQPILSDNCYFCHGPDANHREAGLRLDREEEAAAVVEPGDSEASELVRRIVSDDSSEVMPPIESNRALSKEEIELLRRWIDEGAEWGVHWSFAPLAEPPLPAVDVELWGAEGAANPIDAFVAAKLSERGWQFAPEASRATLIRRVTLDLTGLPPRPAEVEAFLNDPAPDAYEKLVDRLLQNPAYGERMAWDWLDAARYADSNGYQGDRERTMWPWRDWVIRAFNENLPYDQFTIWQLAGDLLPEATFDQRLATGFCRNHMINGEGGRIPEENRVDYVMDMTETVGTVWLGLTVNCCRCHDHKFDPLSHRDYYSLFAFFNQTPVDGSGGNPQTPPVLAAPTREQQQQIAAAERALKSAEVAHAADASLSSDTAAIEEQLKRLRGEVPKVMVMADAPEPRRTFVLRRGLYNDPGEEVTAEVPSQFPPLADDAPHNRLGLARWLVSPDNPLTARVTVNRLWQQLFGIGLVKTVEDFGVQGEIPLHADLLDWLAADFRDRGWDVKALLREIVTSKTYRQSSAMRFVEADPENRWLARGPRFRMPSWMLRDQALAAGGLLVSAQGGPPVNGYQPAGVWEEATFGKKVYKQDSGAALYRRSLYTFWRRIIAPTIFFDNASRQTCTVQTFRTNTPLHALLTWNDVTFVEAARGLAQRALTGSFPESGSAQGTDSQRIDFVFACLLARPASDAERKVLLAALQRSRSEFASDPKAADALLAMGDSPRDPAIAAIEHAAWTALCLGVLNLDETLTKE